VSGLSRREVLAALAALGGGAAVSGSATAQTESGDWPMLNFDAANTATHPSAETLGGLEQDWAIETAAPVRNQPTLGDGVLYAPTKDGTVYALDAESGDEEWTFTADEAVETAVAVGESRVFCASNAGTVYAVNRESGEEDWRLEHEVAVTWSPLVTDGVVVGGANGVFAADAESGEVLWRRFAPLSSSPPAVADGTVFVQDSDELWALDADSGEDLWSQSLQDNHGAAPSVADGVVVVPNSEGPLYGFDASTGEKLWTVPISGTLSEPASIADGTVYAGTWSPPMELYAVDLQSGDVEWSQGVDGSVVSAPVPAGDELLVGTSYVQGHDRETGEKLWEWKNLGGGTPIVVGDRCYVGSESPKGVYAADATGGSGGGSGPVPGFGVGGALLALLGGAWLRARRD